MKRIMVICISLFFFIGCIPGIGDKITYYEYQVVNASDHVIDILVEENGPAYDVFPEELTLHPSEDFFWENPRMSMGSTRPVPFWASSVLTTFDDVYTIHTGGDLPTSSEYIITKRGKGQLDLVTYTFTNADYEAARAIVEEIKGMIQLCPYRQN